MSNTATAPSAGDALQFGKYRLVERLGRGGMAEVWKARMIGPAGFERTMVIKRILPHLLEDQAFIDMFVSEARLSARLNHTNIIAIFELGEHEGEYFLAMEYVRGRDLMGVLRAHTPLGPLPPGFAAYVLREVSRALAYAHSLTDEDGRPLRIIHRDISPSNVMIGFDGAVKLLDFGIAKALEDTKDARTNSGSLKGKFGYMSPEQVEGVIDHRSDLFAVGVLLHECLTVRRLFKAASDLKTLEMVRAARVDPPSKSNPEVPPELDAVCLKALARDAADRYQDGEELAAALDPMVRAFDWGPERMAVFMRSLFPDQNTGPVMRVDPAQLTGENLLSRSRRKRSRRTAMWVGVGALGLLGAAGGGGALWWRSSGSAPAVSATAATGNNPPARAPDRPPAVAVLDSNPAGAEVFVDGSTVMRGVTPLEIAFVGDEARHKVLLRREGYLPMEREILRGDFGERTFVKLVRDPSAPSVTPIAPPPTAATTTPTTSSSTGSSRSHRAAVTGSSSSTAATRPVETPAASKAVAPVAAPATTTTTTTTTRSKKPEDVIKGDFVDPFGEK